MLLDSIVQNHILLTPCVANYVTFAQFPCNSTGNIHVLCWSLGPSFCHGLTVMAVANSHFNSELLIKFLTLYSYFFNSPVSC